MELAVRTIGDSTGSGGANHPVTKRGVLSDQDAPSPDRQLLSTR
jgi:hypothetical protein